MYKTENRTWFYEFHAKLAFVFDTDGHYKFRE